MLQWSRSEAFSYLKKVFSDLGYEYLIVDELQGYAPSGIEPSRIRIFKIQNKPTYLILERHVDKGEAFGFKRFLELFSLGRHHRRRPFRGRIWEIKDPDNLIERGYVNNSLEAQIFTLDMGRTYEKLNGKFHIGSGYLAVYPDGFSNMILLEWFEGDASGIKGPKWVEGIGGELLYGENAYQRLLELRTSEWSFYPSINRTVIP